MNQSMLCCSIGGGYCRRCGVLVGLPGARAVDAPSGGRSVTIVWRKCWWVCPDPGCLVVSFVEQDDTIAAPQGSLTRRARVGDRSAPLGTRFRERAASPARLRLADVMGGDQTTVSGGRRR